MQVKEMKAFLAQFVGSSGKGPRSLTHDRTDRNTQIHTTEGYTAEFVDRSARQQAREENNNPQGFVLSSDVRHRPLKFIEGSFVTKIKERK